MRRSHLRGWRNRFRARRKVGGRRYHPPRWTRGRRGRGRKDTARWNDSTGRGGSRVSRGRWTRPDEADVRRFPAKPGPDGEQQRRAQRPCGVRYEIPHAAMSPPRHRHALGDLDERSHEQRREERPDAARARPPELYPRNPVEAGEQRDVRVVVQREDEHLYRGKELLALRDVHAEVGLRGKIEEPEHHECKVGPALAAQGDKSEESEDARTDANG